MIRMMKKFLRRGKPKKIKKEEIDMIELLAEEMSM